MDYCLDLKWGLNKINRDFNETLLECMDNEAIAIVACIDMIGITENMVTVLEKDASSTSSTSLWQKIKDFFNKIFKVFTNKCSELFDRDNKWLAERITRFRDMSVVGYSIEMTPYWLHDHNSIKSFTKQSLSSLFNDMNSFSKKLSMNVSEHVDSIKAPEFNVIREYTPDNGSIADGFKNYLRCKNVNKIVQVKLEGNKLKNVISDAVEFCLSYKKTTLPFLKSQISYIDKEINTISRKMDKVKENFILIDDCSVYESELSLLPGFDILMEAVDEDKKVSKTSVTVTKKDDGNKDVDNKEEKTKEDTVKGVDYNKSTKGELRYLNQGMQHCKMLLASIMTVMEEKYTAYMNLLRSLDSKITGNKNKESDIIKITTEKEANNVKSELDELATIIRNTKDIEKRNTISKKYNKLKSKLDSFLKNKK